MEDAFGVVHVAQRVCALSLCLHFNLLALVLSVFSLCIVEQRAESRRLVFTC